MSMFGWCNQGDDGFRGTSEDMAAHAARKGVQNPMYQLMELRNSNLYELLKEAIELIKYAEPVHIQRDICTKWRAQRQVFLEKTKDI